jgi:hypothetical protein
MNVSRFRDLLDVHGSDIARWPRAIQDDARRFVAQDREAQAALAQAQRIDALIAAAEREPAADKVEAAVGRVTAALLARPLPPQHRRGFFARWWWPAELLDLDFAPAWPRIAALASVAALGFAVGLAELGAVGDLDGSGGAGTVAMASAEAGLAAVMFEPDPLVGGRQ